jgi:hypothetical protein
MKIEEQVKEVKEIFWDFAIRKAKEGINAESGTGKNNK